MAQPIPPPARGTTRDLTTGADLLAAGLRAHGVTRTFGIPGTHNLPIFASLGWSGIGNITTRHEQGAGYAADAYARVCGQPGVAITTTGPALLNIAAAVGQANSDSVPMLVVSPGLPLAHPALPSGFLHEMRGSQQLAMSQVAAISHRVSSAAEIGVAVARAFTHFRHGRPGPAYLEIPADLLGSCAQPTGVPVAPEPELVTASPADAERAASILHDAGTAAVVLGGGARSAAAECRELAERLGAPVVTTANGKGIVSESHPLSVGVALHSPAVQRWLADRDVVVAVGTELAESDFWRQPTRLGRVLVRIDIDPGQMYSAQTADISLVTDARAGLRQLLGRLPARRRPRHARAQAAARGLIDARDAPDRARDSRWVPYLRALRQVLAPDAIITSDSAMCCYYGALPHLPLGPEGRFLHPTGFGTLGFALPAAVGALAAAPGRQVLALSGDGGLQFTIQELGTVADCGRPLPIVVFDNGGYGEIRAEMAERQQVPQPADLKTPDLAQISRAYGGHGGTVRSPAELAAAVQEALGRPGPTIVVIPEQRF
jgi:5-guanidino-2-oxopentanoate decarboxylase